VPAPTRDCVHEKEATFTIRSMGQVDAIHAAAQSTTDAVGGIAATIAQSSGTARAVAAAADDQDQVGQEIARAIASAAEQTIAGRIGTMRAAAASNGGPSGRGASGRRAANQGSHIPRSAIPAFPERVRTA
jgi:hypothetical protein